MAKKKKTFLTAMKTKLAFIFTVAILVFVALLGRVIYISIAKGEEYQEEILSQQTYDSMDLNFKRGDIVDRNGNVLATSNKIYNMILEPKNILETDKTAKATREAVLKYFADFITEEEYDEFLSDSSSYYKVAVKGLSYSDIKDFEDYCATSAGSYVSGVWFDENYVRTYPNGSLACHILGYTVSGNVGQGGIEGYYSSYLNGTDGQKYGYLTSDNTVESVTVEPEDGYTVVSTIDLNIQKIIEDKIAEYMEETGADNIGVVAMDPDTGEVLGMACSYSYDPNNPFDTDTLRQMAVSVTFTSSTSDDEEDEDAEVEETTVTLDFASMTDAEFEETIDGLTSSQIYEALDSVWRNFCISDTYEPGSTYKTFTIAGAVEDAIVADGDTFYCDGSEDVGDYTIYCHNRYGDGVLTLKQALEQSCNDALMYIAKLEGAEIFDKYQTIFNFGSKTGIDLSGESSGLTYTADTLNSTELATSSFGQGVNVTMIQMAAAFCSVVNGGNYYEPHIVKEILDSDGSIIEEIEPVLVRKTISQTTSDLLLEYLQGVVEEGTGTRAAVEGYTIGGKTGTAEKLPRGTGDYILSFIGCSPVENPQIVLYVIVDTPHVDGDQSTSGAGVLLFNSIMTELLPYMNIYQSNDETVVYNGVEEGASSIEESDGTSEGEDGDGSADESGEASVETTDDTATTEAATTELPVNDE